MILSGSGRVPWGGDLASRTADDSLGGGTWMDPDFRIKWFETRVRFPGILFHREVFTMVLQMEASKVEKRQRTNESEPRYKHNFKPEDSDSPDEVQSVKIDTKGDKLCEEGSVHTVEELGMMLQNYPEQVDLNDFDSEEDN